MSKTFVGYHCTNTLPPHNGRIHSYYENYANVLLNILDTHPKSREYLRLVLQQEYTHELREEIETYFEEIGLNWIFIYKSRPLQQYGIYPYAVYFDLTNVFCEPDNMYMQYFTNEKSYIYIYWDNNPPELRGLDVDEDVFTYKDETRAETTVV